MSTSSDSISPIFSDVQAAGSFRSSIKQSSQVQKQTFRWLGLSRTLWALIVEDSSYTIVDDDMSGLLSFFDVMAWKTQGKVNDEEFSFLYSEWMRQCFTSAEVENGNVKAAGCRPDLQTIRQLLLEMDSSEKHLNDYIGLLLNETNLNFINVPISYAMRDYNSRNYSNLELCNKEWLTLCEALFFTLDINGNGYLNFDEAFFLCGCLVIGSLSADSIAGSISGLELSTLAAMTTQFMKEVNDNYSLNMSNENFFIYLPAFKQHFISKGIGSNPLTAVLQVMHDPVYSIRRWWTCLYAFYEVHFFMFSIDCQQYMVHV